MKTIVKPVVVSVSVILNICLLTGPALYGGKKGKTTLKSSASSVEPAHVGKKEAGAALENPVKPMEPVSIENKEAKAIQEIPVPSEELVFISKKEAGTALEYPVKPAEPVFIENKEVKIIPEIPVPSEEPVFFGNKEGATTEEYFDNLRGMHPPRSSEQDQFSLEMINDKKSGKIEGLLRVYRWTYKGVEHVHAMTQTSSGGWQGPQPAEGYYSQNVAPDDFEYIK